MAQADHLIRIAAVADIHYGSAGKHPPPHLDDVTANAGRSGFVIPDFVIHPWLGDCLRAPSVN
ncbi:MAG: hypothetical protein ACRDUY_15180, partial [Nitriliruptorales bacterium]